MPSSSSSSDTCVIAVDNGADQQQQCHPAKEHAVVLAKAIDPDDGKREREKKECGGRGVGIDDNDNAPGFAVG